MKMTTMVLKPEIKEQLGIIYDVMKLYGLCNNVSLNEEQFKIVKEQTEKQKTHTGDKLKLKDYFNITTKEIKVN